MNMRLTNFIDLKKTLVCTIFVIDAIFDEERRILFDELGNGIGIDDLGISYVAKGEDVTILAGTISFRDAVCDLVVIGPGEGITGVQFNVNVDWLHGGSMQSDGSSVT